MKPWYRLWFGGLSWPSPNFQNLFVSRSFFVVFATTADVLLSRIFRDYRLINVSEMSEGWSAMLYILFQANFVSEIFAQCFRRWLLERNREEEKEMDTGRHKVGLNDFVVLINLEFTCGLTRRKMVELNFLRCSGRRRASLVGFCMPGSSDILDAWTGRKAFELWRRVLTTSSGQVTTAPAVPATLLGEMKTLVKLILMVAEICTKKLQPIFSLQDAIVHDGLCKYLRRCAKSREGWRREPRKFKIIANAWLSCARVR